MTLQKKKKTTIHYFEIISNKHQSPVLNFSYTLGPKQVLRILPEILSISKTGESLDN